MAGIGLIVSYFIMSFMWVRSGILNKMFVYEIPGWGHEPIGEVIKFALSIIIMFLFAFLTGVTKGGAYNPLTALAAAISGDFSDYVLQGNKILN